MKVGPTTRKLPVFGQIEEREFILLFLLFFLAFLAYPPPSQLAWTQERENREKVQEIPRSFISPSQKR